MERFGGHFAFSGRRQCCRELGQHPPHRTGQYRGSDRVWWFDYFCMGRNRGTLKIVIETQTIYRAGFDPETLTEIETHRSVQGYWYYTEFEPTMTQLRSYV